MLVTFFCDAHENITMFGDVAKRLIQMMGHSGAIPSAIRAKDVPAALTALQLALSEQARQNPTMDDAEEEDGPKVSLSHRAFPLIKLLQNAIQAEVDVLWKAA